MASPASRHVRTYGSKEKQLQSNLFGAGQQRMQQAPGLALKLG